MLMKPRISIFSNPDNYRECNQGYHKRDDSANKHLVNSFGIYEKRNNYNDNKRDKDTKFTIKRKLEEKFTGKSSSDDYFRSIHKSFCQEFSSSAPRVHTESVSWTGNYVKAHNRASKSCSNMEIFLKENRLQMCLI